RGNILITRLYFVKGLGHNLFSDLEVAFRRNACFVRNLEGVDLLKGDRSINLYTINLHEMASVSPICLMAHASFTKSWLWNQQLSHLNFDTINDLARNDHVAGLPKFKYHKEHLCPFCEQGKSKRASHPPKLVPNSRQRLHLLHMDLCGPMRIASINGDCYCVFPQNRSIIHRRFNKTPYELINGRKPDISFLHVFGALCYPKNDREDIGKLGAKGDIGFFIGYSADSCAYRIYNRRTKKIMETMNVLFDELSVMDFEQRSSKPGLQSNVENDSPAQEPQVRQTNDLVAGLPKFKYHKEHLCPSCEQGKSKRACHPPKPVPNSRQRLHLLHMDLCGPMRIASINGKRYVLVIVDGLHFLRSKDEAPEVIIKFLKRITVLLQSPVIIIRTDNGTEFNNQVLKEYFDTVRISHQMSSVRTLQQNGVVERRNWTLVEDARTMLIFSRAPLFLWAEAIAT
nr:putative ribonuclease H-like domain-containing protein [Tanacetum cinerariifolium]